MSIYPKRTVDLAFPEARTVSTAHKWENEISRDPRVFAWFRGDGYDASTGTWTEHRWRDRNSFARQFLQATSGYRPTLTADWKSTGMPAVHFDGTDDRLDSDFAMPQGTKTMVVAFSMDAGSATTQGLITGADSSSNSELYGVYIHQARVSFNGHNPDGPTATTLDTRRLFIGGMDWINNVYFMGIDNDTDFTSDITALASPHLYVPGSATVRLGSFNSGLNFIGAQNQAEILMLNCSLYDADHSALRTMIVEYLNDRYGESW